MVWYLLKRDPLFRFALVWLLQSSVLVFFNPGLEGHVVYAHIVSCTYLFLLAALMGVPLSQRSTYFEAGLPIAGRQLFAVRVAGILTMVGLPIAAAAASWAVRGTSNGKLLLLVFVQAGAVVTPAAILHTLICPKAALVPFRIGIAYWVAVVLVGGAALFMMPPAIQILICATASAVGFGLAWKATPPAFQFAPSAAASDSTPVRPAVAYAAWRPILRTAYPWLAILVFPAGLFSGVVPTFGYLVLPVVFLAFLTNRQGTRWLQTTPLSRGALLHIGLAVAVVPYMVGAAIGMALHPSLPPPFFGSMVGVGPHLKYDFADTNLPLEFWRYAPGGNVPPIRAPWGESVQPQSLSIAGLTFYNPYDSQKANTARFCDWQVGRATEAVHGQRLSRQQYEDFFMQVAVPSGINWHAPRLPQILDGPRIEILTWAAYFYGCLALMFLHELLLSHVLHRPGWLSVRVVAALAAIPLVTAFAFDEYYLLRQSTPVIAPLARMFLLHLSDRLPQNFWELAALASIPAILLYLLVWWQFTRSEMTLRLVRALPGLTLPELS